MYIGTHSAKAKVDVSSSFLSYLNENKGAFEVIFSHFLSSQIKKVGTEKLCVAYNLNILPFNISTTSHLSCFTFITSY